MLLPPVVSYFINKWAYNHPLGEVLAMNIIMLAHLLIQK